MAHWTQTKKGRERMREIANARYKNGNGISRVARHKSTPSTVRLESRPESQDVTQASVTLVSAPAVEPKSQNRKALNLLIDLVKTEIADAEKLIQDRKIVLAYLEGQLPVGE